MELLGKINCEMASELLKMKYKICLNHRPNKYAGLILQVIF